MFFDFLSLSKVQPIKTSIVVCASLCASSTTLLLLLRWPLKHHSQGVLVVLLFFVTFLKDGFSLDFNLPQFFESAPAGFPAWNWVVLQPTTASILEKGAGGITLLSDSV